MATQWNCKFKNPKSPITVGDVLLLNCDQDNSISNPQNLNLKKDLQIAFPDSKDEYRLKVLKTLYIEPGHIDLEVAPYKPGSFSGSFFITDGVQQLEVKNFQLEVASVFKQKANQNQVANPPMGPFAATPPYLHVGAFIVSASFFVAMIIVIIAKFFKRKQWIDHIIKRQSNYLPSKIFVKELRKVNRNSPNYLKKMESFFKVFLENVFFISAVNANHKSIVKQLKKYEYKIYKKYKLQIDHLLEEFTSLQKFENRDQDLFQIERLCKDLVFSLEKEKTK